MVVACQVSLHFLSNKYLEEDARVADGADMGSLMRMMGGGK